MTQLGLSLKNPFEKAISPLLEMGAFEALWAEANATAKSIAQKFSGSSPPLPSELVDRHLAEQSAKQAIEKIERSKIGNWGVRIHQDGEYPDSLRAMKHTSEILYYQGIWDLIYSPLRVAIVGTRTPSSEGRARARRIAKLLTQDKVTIFSGLAKGIDAAAHTACVEAGGKTVAVLGTPITKVYPRENSQLQQEIANNHLLVSHVPINRYDMQKNPTHNRHFFPARNITMSALTDATIIIEASETSGTLVQAKAAISQGKQLFILDSCFNNRALSWPEKFEKLGAIRVRNYDDIQHRLFSKEAQPN